MKLVVGLGNPGEKYEGTRHNLGFAVLDVLLKKFEPLSNTFWEKDKKNKSDTKKIKIGKSEYMLVKPTTFMNSSGEAVSRILSYYKISPEDLILVHDDLDLPLGKIRVRFGGGAGGHNGVTSVIDALQSDKFLRIRLGLGHPGRPTDDKKRKVSKEGMEGYILSRFEAHEKSKVKEMTKQVIGIIDRIEKNGVEKYMSKYNS